MKYSILAFVGLWIVASTGSAQSVSPETLAGDFVNAWNAHESKGFERLYTEDATWVPVAEVLDQGRDAILSDLMVAHTSWAKNTTLALAGDVTLRTVRPDVALLFFHLRYVDKDPSKTGKESAMLLVATKGSDGWRISAGQLTKPSPPRP